MFSPSPGAFEVESALSARSVRYSSPFSRSLKARSLTAFVVQNMSIYSVNERGNGKKCVDVYVKVKGVYNK